MLYSRTLKQPRRKMPAAGKKDAKKKRAPTAYNKFMATEYKKIKAAHPDMKATEIFKKAASGWKKAK